MATDEDNHKNEARDDWTGCTFRVERGPSSEGRAWGMAEVLTNVSRRAGASRLPLGPPHDRATSGHRPPRAGVRGPRRGPLDQRRDEPRRRRVRGAAFAAGASGKKKLNKREQQDLDEATDTSAQRVLDELDANQDANDGDDDGEEQVRARVANFMRIASMA